MSKFPSLECRSLKKDCLWFPDVYTQLPNQLEDRLSEELVKDGFKFSKPVASEYDSARSLCSSMDMDSVWNTYYSIVVRKARMGNYCDSKKRGPTNAKDSTNTLIERNKLQISDWFSELAGSSPYLPKCKKDILLELANNNVSISRALWFINMNVIQSSALAESFNKRPRLVDLTPEWTTTLTLLLDQVFSGAQLNRTEFEKACRDWDYLFSLLMAMYDNDLAEHWDVLKWLVSKIENLHEMCLAVENPDQLSCSTKEFKPIALWKDKFGPLKFVLPYILRFGIRFTESELLTRRLLYWSCSAFTKFASDCTQRPPSINFLERADEYFELISCHYHQVLIMPISSLIISSTLNCPSAAVWNKLSSNVPVSYLSGSPLDLLPCPLTLLPIPPGPEASKLRQCLAQTEAVLVERGKLAETGWCLLPSAITTDVHCSDANMETFVRILDILDRQDFSKPGDLRPIDTLLMEIFSCSQCEDIHYVFSLVTFLCQWAVSPTRTGFHRPIVVVCLFEQLRATYTHITQSLFQDCLINFLDMHAPANSGSVTAPEAGCFRSLVCLFAELIDRGIFDHDAFVRTYIARGVFDSSFHPYVHEALPSAPLNSSAPHSNLGLTGNSTSRVSAMGCSSLLLPPTNLSGNFSIQSEVSEDNDRNSVENPDSVRSDFGGLPPVPVSGATSISRHPTLSGAGEHPVVNRYLQYLVHFPIPQDPFYSHEQNQRAQILYGSMRARCRAKDRIRKLVRDLTKIFTKTVYLMDVVHGEMGKRKKCKDREKLDKDNSLGLPLAPNQLPSSTANQRVSKDNRLLDDIHEEIFQRFRCLSYYDMESVISQAMPAFLKILSINSGPLTTTNNSINALGNDCPEINTSINLSDSHALSASPLTSTGVLYLPVPSTIFLFFDLIETSLNVTCLLYTVVDTFECLKALAPRSQSMSSYVSVVSRRLIGILHAHQPVLMTMRDLRHRLIFIVVGPVIQDQEQLQWKRCIDCLNDVLKASYIIPRNGQYIDPNYFDGMQVGANYMDRLLNNTGDGRVAFRACLEDIRSNSQARKIFMNRAISAVCEAHTIERLNYLFDLFTELTTLSKELTFMWDEALITIVTPTNSPDFLVRLDNSNAWDNLASLFGTLLARQCICTSDFFVSMNFHALAQGLDQGSAPVDSKHEPTVRFACHVLHRLFTAEPLCANPPPTTSNSLAPIADAEGSTASPAMFPQFRVAEPLLLTGALQKLKEGVFVDTLKMLMVHSDKGDPDPEDCRLDENDAANDSKSGSALLSDGDDNSSDNETRDSASDDNTDYVASSIDTIDFDAVDGPLKNRRKRRRVPLAPKNKKRRGRAPRKAAAPCHSVNRRPAPTHCIHLATLNFLLTGVRVSDADVRAMRLRDFAYLVLREVCVTPWVRETFYRISSRLLKKHVLIDEELSPSLARHLLHIIYQPHDVKWVDIVSETNCIATAMESLLSNLNLWTLHSTYMEFNLLYEQMPPVQETDILSKVAQSIVENFNNQTQSYLKPGFSVDSTVACDSLGRLPTIEVAENDSVWLLLPLMVKLPLPFKKSIVETTWVHLHYIKDFLRHKNDENKERTALRYSVILAHPAFSALLQLCMQDTDSIEQLYRQVDFFLQNAKETRDRMPENLRTRHVLQECLGLRLALVGRRFISGPMDGEQISKWALMLAQLIGFGVTEPYSNQTLFFTCLDMLHTLVHNLVAQSGMDSKLCTRLARNIRRELNDRRFTAGIEYIKPLFFIGRSGYSFVVVNSIGVGAGSGGPGSGNRRDGGGAGSGKLSGNTKSSNPKLGGKASYTRSGGVYDLAPGGGIKSFSRKRGYVFTGRERLAPWDVYDPVRRPQLLVMCGATHTETSLSRVEEQANLLISHEHPVRMRRSVDFYFNSIFPEPEATAQQISTEEFPLENKPICLSSPTKKTLHAFESVDNTGGNSTGATASSSVARPLGSSISKFLPKSEIAKCYPPDTMHSSMPRNMDTPWEKQSGVVRAPQVSCIGVTAPPNTQMVSNQAYFLSGARRKRSRGQLTGAQQASLSGIVSNSMGSKIIGGPVVMNQYSGKIPSNRPIDPMHLGDVLRSQGSLVSQTPLSEAGTVSDFYWEMKTDSNLPVDNLQMSHSGTFLPPPSATAVGMTPVVPTSKQRKRPAGRRSSASTMQQKNMPLTSVYTTDNGSTTVGINVGKSAKQSRNAYQKQQSTTADIFAFDGGAPPNTIRGSNWQQPQPIGQRGAGASNRMLPGQQRHLVGAFPNTTGRKQLQKPGDLGVGIPSHQKKQPPAGMHYFTLEDQSSQQFRHIMPSDGRPGVSEPSATPFIGDDCGGSGYSYTEPSNFINSISSSAPGDYPPGVLETSALRRDALTQPHYTQLGLVNQSNPQSLRYHRQQHEQLLYPQQQVPDPPPYPAGHMQQAKTITSLGDQEIIQISDGSLTPQQQQHMSRNPNYLFQQRQPSGAFTAQQCTGSPSGLVSQQQHAGHTVQCLPPPPPPPPQQQQQQQHQQHFESFR